MITLLAMGAGGYAAAAVILCWITGPVPRVGR